MEASPLILTLRLNEEAFLFFNALRQQYFPPQKNFLSAHLTLFHHLPADEPLIFEELQNISSQTSALNIRVTEIVSIGKGVAFKLESESLLALHKSLQEKWKVWLMPQDRQKLWPHVTIQNKVHPTLAKETLLQVKQSFQPFQAAGLGLQLWSYEGGPWKFIKEFPFDQSIQSF